MTKLLTLAQVADQLQVSERTARRLVDRGELPALRIGRQVRVLATPASDRSAGGLSSGLSLTSSPRLPKFAAWRPHTRPIGWCDVCRYPRHLPLSVDDRSIPRIRTETAFPTRRLSTAENEKPRRLSDLTIASA